MQSIHAALPIVCGFFALSLQSFCNAQEPSGKYQEVLATIAVTAQTKFNSPAVWMAVSENGKVEGVFASGQSNLEKGIAATIDDRVPLGSITKAMTGTLTCVLINKGILGWDTKASTILPELFRANLPASPCLDATVEELLTHRAGLWSGSYPKSPTGDTPSAIRYNFVKLILSKSPVAKVGEKSSYAAGCEIVGLMLETITGEPLEQLFQKYLFEPCGVKGEIDLGDPSVLKGLAPPIGYTEKKKGRGYSVLDGENPTSWLPGLYGAAGAMYGTIDSICILLAKCASEQNPYGGRFLNDLLTVPKGAFHTKAGWVREGQLIYHTGGNGRGQSAVVINLDTRICVSFVMNQCDGKYFPAYLDFVKNLHKN